MSQKKKKKTKVSKQGVDYRLSKGRRGPRKNKNNNKKDWKTIGSNKMGFC